MKEEGGPLRGWGGSSPGLTALGHRKHCISPCWKWALHAVSQEVKEAGASQAQPLVCTLFLHPISFLSCTLLWNCTEFL